MKKRELKKMAVLEATDEMMEMAKNDIPRKRQGYYNTVYNEYKHSLYLRAVMENNTLKVALFLTEHMRAGGKKAAYELYIDKAAKQFITYDARHEKWVNAKLDMIDFPGHIYSSETYIEPQSAGVVKSYLSVPVGNYEAILNYQRHIRQVQLAERDRKVTEAWDKQPAQVPALPKDWEHWVDKSGITENFIFYQYKKGGAKEGYCSWCEKTVPIKNPRYGKKGKCRCCGHNIQYKSIGKIGRFYTKKENAYLMQRCREGFVIRGFEIYKYYPKGEYKNPEISCTETMRGDL